jgi:hypothetical protein
MKTISLVAVLLFSISSSAQSAKPAKPSAPKPFVIEFYYKVQWGHAEEFWNLFEKNHLPILKRQMAMGRITALKAEKPIDHHTEDGRWDYRITITYRDLATAFDQDSFDAGAIVKELYPDQAKFKQEEQRRFEILLAHWDLPIDTLELK